MGISRFPIRPGVDLKNINSASPRCQRGHAVSNPRPDAPTTFTRPTEAALPFRLTLASVASVEMAYEDGDRDYHHLQPHECRQQHYGSTLPARLFRRL